MPQEERISAFQIGAPNIFFQKGKSSIVFAEVRFILDFIFTAGEQLFVQGNEIIIRHAGNKIGNNQIRVFGKIIPVFIILLRLHNKFDMVAIDYAALAAAFNLVQKLIIKLGKHGPYYFVILPVYLLVFINNGIILLLGAL